MDRLRGERVKNKNKVQKNERLRENQKFFILKFMTGSFFQPRKFAEKRSEKVPDGPGVCDVCATHCKNLLLHMADQHRVTILT